MVTLFQDFPGKEFSEVVYHSLLLGTSWVSEVCPRSHRLALLKGGTVGNQTPNLWLRVYITETVTSTLAGHVVRMADGEIPKDLLYGELVQGNHPRERPQLRYKDIR